MKQNDIFLNAINSPARKLDAFVELRNSDSTILKYFRSEDKLVNFKIDRAGEGKFFGYGVCQKLTLELLDVNKEVDLELGQYFVIHCGWFNNYGNYYHYDTCNFPYFYITEVSRDEVTNKITVIAYDKLYEASAHTLAEMSKSTNFNVYKIAWGCCNILGLQMPLLMNGNIEEDSAFTRNYVFSVQPQSATYNLVNQDGTETLREVLDDIAEATQTIYFIENDTLYFSRLGTENKFIIINKDNYFDFKLDTSKKVAAITSTNELGDAVTASNDTEGETVYIKDNMLWDLQVDIGNLVDNALNRVEDFELDQFALKWRGNPLLTIGDRLKIERHEDNDGLVQFAINIYYTNSVLTYNGGFSEEISWEYSESDLETANNPTSLGDVLKQTSAKVDKVNKEITLLVDSVGTLSNFVMSEDGITASVMEKVQKNYAAKDEIPSLTPLENRVKAAESKLTADALNLTFGTYIDEEGIGKKVVTETGFTFDEEGLTVSKANSEMNTTITEDGMTVYRNDEAMLTANNQGVDAVNLKASTYLIIGKNSRFEDYGNKRTGCFWIGG